MKKFFVIGIAFLIMSCGANIANVFTTPRLVAIDSTNDRLFVLQDEQELVVSRASDLQPLGTQPAISEDLNAGLQASLSLAPIATEVVANGTTSQLYILGGRLVDDALAFNHVTVLEFDGTTFNEASFSPVTISDLDSGTIETGDVFADLLVHGDYFYVTNVSKGMVHKVNRLTGSTESVFIVNSSPRRLGLSAEHLFVCDANDDLTVINLDSLVQTEIDLECDLLAVFQNSNGTVLVTRPSNSNVINIVTVDESTYASATVLTSLTAGITDGLLTAGAGITESPQSLAGVVLTDETLVFYVGEQDGAVSTLTVNSDLTGFTHEAVDTVVTGLEASDVYLSVNKKVYFLASSGALVALTDGSSSPAVTR